jgi:hypothetical protein
MRRTSVVPSSCIRCAGQDGHHVVGGGGRPHRGLDGAPDQLVGRAVATAIGVTPMTAPSPARSVDGEPEEPAGEPVRPSTGGPPARSRDGGDVDVRGGRHAAGDGGCGRGPRGTSPAAPPQAVGPLDVRRLVPARWRSGHRAPPAPGRPIAPRRPSPSVPSKTRCFTSDTSAPGSAQIMLQHLRGGDDGVPAATHEDDDLCRWGTSSIGHEMPRSPRATSDRVRLLEEGGSAATGRRLDLGLPGAAQRAR